MILTVYQIGKLREILGDKTQCGTSLVCVLHGICFLVWCMSDDNKMGFI